MSERRKLAKQRRQVPNRVEREALFYFESEQDKPRMHEAAGGRVVSFSTRSPDKATSNEDSIALIPLESYERGGVLAVADGLGGLPAGEAASSVCLTELAQSVRSSWRGSKSSRAQLRASILDGIENANRAVLEQGGGATTLAVVEIFERSARSYHVGDSSILHMGQRGRIKSRTVAHSPVGYALRSGLLSEEDAMHHEERHLVSNVVGSEKMQIEIGPEIDISARDTLVVASDGLSDNMYELEIVEAVRKGDLMKGAAALIEECRERMVSPAGKRPSKPDDLSVLIFRL